MSPLMKMYSADCFFWADDTVADITTRRTIRIFMVNRSPRATLPRSREPQRFLFLCRWRNVGNRQRRQDNALQPQFAVCWVIPLVQGVRPSATATGTDCHG